MAEPFIGQISLFAFPWYPAGCLPCQGGVVLTLQYQALYSLIGTLFGGDGRNTFGLPNLAGRVAVGPGRAAGGSITWQQAAIRGDETVFVTQAGLPSHNHVLSLSATASQAAAQTGAVLSSATTPAEYQFHDVPADTILFPSSLTAAGQGGGHENRQPYLVLNPVIAVDGVYPSFD